MSNNNTEIENEIEVATESEAVNQISEVLTTGDLDDVAAMLSAVYVDTPWRIKADRGGAFDGQESDVFNRGRREPQGDPVGELLALIAEDIFTDAPERAEQVELAQSLARRIIEERKGRGQ